LRAALPALAVIKFSFMLDHYVAVLAVNEREVVVADPMAGIMKYSPAEFLEKWRKSGVTVQRSKLQAPSSKEAPILKLQGEAAGVIVPSLFQKLAKGGGIWLAERMTSAVSSA